MLTIELVSLMIDDKRSKAFQRDDSQDRSAKQRGKVAHTARPEKPGSAELEVRPLESRMKSAERYYHPIEVDDGLSQDGGPEVEDAVNPGPTEGVIVKRHQMPQSPR